MMPNGEIELAYCQADYLEEAVDGIPYGPLNLIQKPVSEHCDIIVDPIAISDKDVTPNAEINIISDVYNYGSNTVNSFDVTVTDSNDAVLYTTTLEQSLAPNESTELSVPITLPASIAKTDYTVTILPTGCTDKDLTNNSSVLSFGFADLVIEDIKEIRESNGRKLSVTVTNLGYDTIDEATVNLYNDGVNGTLISSQALTSIAPNSTNELLFDISNSDFVAEDGSKTESLYFVSVDSEASEYDYANNSDSIKLYPDCLVTLTAQTGGTVTGSGTYADGSFASISATPNDGYIFDGWYEDGKLLEGVPQSVDLSVNSDKKLEARFSFVDFGISRISTQGKIAIGSNTIYSIEPIGSVMPREWDLKLYFNGELKASANDTQNVECAYRPNEPGTVTVVATITYENGQESIYEYSYSVRSYSARRGELIPFANKLPNGVVVKSWESTNEKVATVDEYGNVTGQKLGETIIYAHTEDGSYSWTVETKLNWWQTLLISFGIGIIFLPFWRA